MAPLGSFRQEKSALVIDIEVDEDYSWTCPSAEELTQELARLGEQANKYLEWIVYLHDGPPPYPYDPEWASESLLTWIRYQNNRVSARRIQRILHQYRHSEKFRENPTASVLEGDRTVVINSTGTMDSHDYKILLRQFGAVESTQFSPTRNSAEVVFRTHRAAMNACKLHGSRPFLEKILVRRKFSDFNEPSRSLPTDLKVLFTPFPFTFTVADGQVDGFSALLNKRLSLTNEMSWEELSEIRSLRSSAF